MQRLPHLLPRQALFFCGKVICIFRNAALMLRRTHKLPIRISAMQLRPLGRTGFSIAPVVFGGNVFGWTADKRMSFDLLDRFSVAGFNAIDTANSYQT